MDRDPDRVGLLRREVRPDNACDFVGYDMRRIEPAGARRLRLPAGLGSFVVVHVSIHPIHGPHADRTRDRPFEHVNGHIVVLRLIHDPVALFPHFHLRAISSRRPSGLSIST